jgi:hypothetical protein
MLTNFEKEKEWEKIRNQNKTNMRRRRIKMGEKKRK